VIFWREFSYQSRLLCLLARRVLAYHYTNWLRIQGPVFHLIFFSPALLSFYLSRLNNESRNFFRLYNVKLERSRLGKIRKSIRIIHIDKESRGSEDEERVKNFVHEKQSSEKGKQKMIQTLPTNSFRIQKRFSFLR
jgi:hypothetical protein